MTRDHVVGSLQAVDEALTHFRRSLERAGFVAGASAYQQMSEIIFGQWLWVQAQGERDLEPRFDAVSTLAGSIAGQLAPYVEAMSRLAALKPLIEERWGVDPDTDAGRIMSALLSGGPMRVEAIRQTTRLPASTVRRELEAMVEAGLVDRAIGERRFKVG